MNPLKTFISIPITGHRLGSVKKHCQYVKENICKNGVSPFDIEGWEPGKAWEWYMARTLEAVRECDCIFLCNGWEDSAGCRLEMEYAKYLGKTIVYEIPK